MKYKINHEFPKLTSNRRMSSLKYIGSCKKPKFIEKQIRTKLQLRCKIIPVPEASSKFKPPKLFPASVEESFKPITLNEFKKKLKRTIVLGPVDKTETFEKEIKNLEHINSTKTTLTPCPLCCRAFLTSLAAAKHVLLCHKNFMLEDDHQEKTKYDTPLKSRVNVRVTNLSKLLLKQLSPDAILLEAKIIISRQETDYRTETTIVNDSLENRKPNYHVSGTCEHCINSPNDPTPPILMEILFENQVVNLPIKFQLLRTVLNSLLSQVLPQDTVITVR